MQPKSVDRIENGIKITWDDGHVSPYESEYLRKRCPCATCRNNPLTEPREKIDIKAAHPMGWYALQLIFSDDHDSGIFSYDYLREICQCKECQLKRG